MPKTIKKQWVTTDVKDLPQLEAKLNELENSGNTIFSIMRTAGGYGDHFVIVYYSAVGYHIDPSL